MIFRHFFSRATLTIKNTHACHCHNTKHVRVPLSRYKTCTRTTVTTQNMYTYHSQYKTCTRTTVTIQNMCTYHCQNTKHLHLHCQYKTCTHNTWYCKYNACFQDTGIPAYFAGKPFISHSYFSKLTRLDERQYLYLHSNKGKVS